MSDGNTIYDIGQRAPLELLEAARLAHSALQRMCECIPAYVASGSNLHFDCIAARDKLQAALEKAGGA